MHFQSGKTYKTLQPPREQAKTEWLKLDIYSS